MESQTGDTIMQEQTTTPDTPLQAMLSAATSSRAKFKAEQDVGLPEWRSAWNSELDD